MKEVSPSLEKSLRWTIYGSLIVLALGLVTSTSILALSHILIALPALYFLPRVNYKNFPKSAWILLVMMVIIILSVIFNQDIADKKGLAPILKSKYFLIGFISLAPFFWWKKGRFTERQLSILIYLFCISTSVATIAGIVGMNTGYNYISMRAVNLDRNAGLSGMVLNYAHNLSYFLIIVFGLLLNFKKVRHLVNPFFLVGVFTLNLVGLYLSYTRGAILAFVVGFVFYFFKNHKKLFVGVGVALFALILAAYVSSNGILRPGSDRERISQWKAAIMAFKERPVLGYGYLNFENHSVELKKRYDIGELQFGGHAHNNFLEMLAATGILGFVCYVAWLLCWFVELYRRSDLVSQVGLSLIVAITIGGMTQSTIALGVNLFFIMAAYSLTVSLDNKVEN